MTRQTIDQMIAELIRKEGDFTDHPADKGGPTRFGITQAVARQMGYAGPMQEFPQGLAESIYRTKYFVGPGFDKVALISTSIAEELFDTGVNMGVGVPGPWLQRLLNAFTDSPALTVDGKIGPATINALRAFINRRGTAGEMVMVRGLNCLQGARYLEITEARPQNKAFIYGWLLNRIA